MIFCIENKQSHFLLTCFTYKKSSVDVTVASISKPKSNSARLAEIMLVKEVY